MLDFEFVDIDYVLVFYLYFDYIGNVDFFDYVIFIVSVDEYVYMFLDVVCVVIVYFEFYVYFEGD